MLDDTFKMLAETALQGKSIQEARTITSVNTLASAKDALYALNKTTKAFQIWGKDLKKQYKRKNKVLLKKWRLFSKLNATKDDEAFTKEFTNNEEFATLIEDAYKLAVCMSTIQVCLNYYTNEYNIVFDKIEMAKSYLRKHWLKAWKFYIEGEEIDFE